MSKHKPKPPRSHKFADCILCGASTNQWIEYTPNFVPLIKAVRAKLGLDEKTWPFLKLRAPLCHMHLPGGGTADAIGRQLMKTYGVMEAPRTEIPKYLLPDPPHDDDDGPPGGGGGGDGDGDGGEPMPFPGVGEAA